MQLFLMIVDTPLALTEHVGLELPLDFVMSLLVKWDTPEGAIQGVGVDYVSCR